MPIIKSAKKRVRVARKATVRNYKTKRTLTTALKSFHAALTTKKDTGTAHAAAQSAIGKAAKKHVIHKNKAARQQRQLAARAKAAGATTTKSAKKVTTKASIKTTAKKSVAKKTTAKKTTTKKPAPKKK